MRKFKASKQVLEGADEANDLLHPRTLTAPLEGETTVEETSVSEGKITVLLDFKTVKEDAYGKTIYKIHQKSSTNIYKVPPKEILTPCQVDMEAFRVLDDECALNPSPSNTALRKTAKEKCNVTFTALAQWVAANCEDQAGLALSYGFRVGKARRSASTRPGPLVLQEWWYNGDPGAVNFRTSSIGRNARYFVACRLAGSNAEWLICGDSTKSYAIQAKGLTRGKEYEFQLYASNTAGNGVPINTPVIIAAI